MVLVQWVQTEEWAQAQICMVVDLQYPLVVAQDQCTQVLQFQVRDPTVQCLDQMVFPVVGLRQAMDKWWAQVAA